MTLAHGTAIIAEARARGGAVAAMTTYSLEATRGICDAAQAAGLPVILQAGSASFASVGRDALASSALAVARAASVPVGVHLDHSRSLEETERCIALGYTSVMIDAAHLSFEDNIVTTQEVVAVAHRCGVWVEGELGAIAGDENVSTGATGTDLTDPSQAEEFVRRTKVDALAVAIGNVHGAASGAIKLHLERLRAIANVIDVPLVLHGTSGVNDDELLAAINLGVAKVNVNTELRRAYVQSLRDSLPVVGDDVRELQALAVAAIAEVAAARLKLMRGAGHWSQG